MGVGVVERLAWFFFVPQLPTSPSSVRVQVWRRLRAVGAITLQNGIWVLPTGPAHEQVLRELVAYVGQHGGTGLLFQAQALDGPIQDHLLAQFRADRAQEYQEFCGQCANLLAELDRETQAAHFNFAELEENEADLQKLDAWLSKIQARDYNPGPPAAAAVTALTRCRQALQQFTAAVYRQEGLEPSEAAEADPPGPPAAAIRDDPSAG